MPETQNTDIAAPATTTAAVAPVAPAAAQAAAKPVTVTPETIVTDPAAPLPSITTEGEPNGLPPAAPGIQKDPPAAVIELREWFHRHIPNSVHSQDTAHYNQIERMVGALAALIHAKYPTAKET